MVELDDANNNNNKECLMRQISDRFLAAVRRCVGPDPVKQRLIDAWSHELEDIGISELPRPLRREFKQLREAMSTAQPQPHESAASASVRKMSAQQAARYTRQILQLSQDLQRISVQTDTLLDADDNAQIVLQGIVAPDRLN